MLDKIVRQGDQNRDVKREGLYLASDYVDASAGNRRRSRRRCRPSIQNECDEHRRRELNDAIGAREAEDDGSRADRRAAPRSSTATAATTRSCRGRATSTTARRRSCPACASTCAARRPRRGGPTPSPRTRGEIFKTIDAAYYGYGDDDDGVLAELEAKAEPALQATLAAEWEEAKRQRHEADPDAAAAEAAADAEAAAAGDDDEEFVAHVEVPDQEAIQRAVLARRKNELLGMLGSAGAG